MSRTPQVNISQLIKTGALDKERFFRLFSRHCNYMSPEAVKDFYMGFVRHVTQQLREEGIVRLPHLGDIVLLKQKDHFGWAGPRQTWLTGKYLIRFFPNQYWRKYFMQLSEKPGREGKLDPREKLLGKEL